MNKKSIPLTRTHKTITLGMAAFLLQATFHAECYADRKWNTANNPKNMGADYTVNFNKIHDRGEADMGNKGWADSYWPKVNGLIADRWQDKTAYFKTDVSPSAEDLKNHRITAEMINLLSPAEKFDLARNKLDFPVATILRDNLKKNDYGWRGLCNGWTQASLNIKEPHPIVVENKSLGIKIPFNSADIKGLLAYYYYHDSSSAKYVGAVCTKAKKFLFDVTGACKDVHPAAMHIVMGNEIGIKHQGFAADRDPTIQVWNQPFTKYRFEVDNIKTSDFDRNATDETRKEVYITAHLTYTNELYDTDDPELETSDHVAPSAEPVMGTSKQKSREVTYQYVLELDVNDNIIGGDWISDDHPDLIWKQTFTLPSIATLEDDTKDNWNMLKDLISMSTDY